MAKQLNKSGITTGQTITTSQISQSIDALTGVDALQLFDTWISHLDWGSCEEFSATYINKIVTALRSKGVTVPITFFGKTLPFCLSISIYSDI